MELYFGMLLKLPNKPSCITYCSEVMPASFYTQLKGLILREAFQCSQQGLLDNLDNNFLFNQDSYSWLQFDQFLSLVK